MNRREMFAGLGVGAAALAGFASFTGDVNAADEAKAKAKDLPDCCKACIAACSACIPECMQCYAHCADHVAAGHADKEMIACMKNCLDCVEFCKMCLTICSRQGAMMAICCDACEKACEQCAKVCEKFPKDARMAACAKACRTCAKACSECCR